METGRIKLSTYKLFDFSSVYFIAYPDGISKTIRSQKSDFTPNEQMSDDPYVQEIGPSCSIAKRFSKQLT